MNHTTKDILKSIFEIDHKICIVTRNTNFNIYDFDFRQFFETRSLFGEIVLPVILRVGAIGNYHELHAELTEMGIQLINTSEQHDRASLLPYWYPLIEKYTARSKCYESFPSATEIMQEFDFPVFIKGERQTNKHKKSLCIAENEQELDAILMLWKNDPILNWQRLICRKFVALEKIDQATSEALQYSKEYRIFLWKHKVAGIGQYWTDARKIELSKEEMHTVSTMAEEVAQLVNVPFLVVDVAKQENGDWIVIELNDAQESGYAGVSKLQLWQTILELEYSDLQ